MSEESTTPGPLQMLLRYREAVRAGDRDTEMSMWAPDAVWDMSNLGLGTFEGWPAILSFKEEWGNRYETYSTEIEEFLDLGNGVAFLTLSEIGYPVGGAPDVRVEESWGYAYVFEERKIVRMVCSRDIDGARAVAERLAEARG
jgi:hypothetical protein